MGRSPSAASSPTVSGTRLAPYPQARLATHYASSDTTLAESLPPSPRGNQPPPYGDEALVSPPLYQEDTLEPEKRHGQPLPKKTLITRLLTSIFIAFIVCLIVAAVVGRIHDTSLRHKQDAQESAAHNSNGTRFTLMLDQVGPLSTPTASITTLAANYTTISHTSIARPSGTTVLTYNCPYITPSATRRTQKPTETARTEFICGLTSPFGKAHNETEEKSIVGVSLHSLKDCVIARTSYKLSRDKLGYRCSLSCSEDGGPGVDGLEDGWKWRCG